VDGRGAHPLEQPVPAALVERPVAGQVEVLDRLADERELAAGGVGAVERYVPIGFYLGASSNTAWPIPSRP
jgi:hypothetical protein